MRTRITLLLSLLCIFSAGCVHKPDIEQGNIVTASKIKQLHHGMSMAEVKSLIGSPMVDVPFNKNRFEYIYTMQKGRDLGKGQRLTLLFKHDKLVDIKYPTSFTIPG